MKISGVVVVVVVVEKSERPSQQGLPNLSAHSHTKNSHVARRVVICPADMRVKRPATNSRNPSLHCSCPSYIRIPHSLYLPAKATLP
jgi:hypothetical protein